MTAQEREPLDPAAIMAEEYLTAIQMPFTEHDQFTDDLARAVVRMAGALRRIAEATGRGDRLIREALTLLNDDSDPEAAAALETLAERTWPALRAALAGEGAADPECVCDRGSRARDLSSAQRIYPRDMCPVHRGEGAAAQPAHQCSPRPGSCATCGGVAR